MNKHYTYIVTYIGQHIQKLICNLGILPSSFHEQFMLYKLLKTQVKSLTLSDVEAVN